MNASACDHGQIFETQAISSPLSTSEPGNRKGVGLLEQDGRTTFCLIKRISAAGARVKVYGKLADAAGIALRISDEDPICGIVVSRHDDVAEIEFVTRLEANALGQLSSKLGDVPASTPPLESDDIRVRLRTGGGNYQATLSGLSMHGATLRADGDVPFTSPTLIDVPGLPSLGCNLRWADGPEYCVSLEAAIPIQIIAGVLAGRQLLSIG